MAKAFSILSRNVEHFKDTRTRAADVVDLIVATKPGVFAFYEVEGMDVFGELSSKMPIYQFHITEGPQVLEIHIAVKDGTSALFTRKIEFRAISDVWLPVGYQADFFPNRARYADPSPERQPPQSLT